MALEILHWALLVGSLGAAFIYFRDLGDITQALMPVERRNMAFAIRHEVHLIGVSAGCVGAAIVTYLFFGAGNGYALLFGGFLVGGMIGFPWVWLHVGFRNQQHGAQFYPIEGAKTHVRPEESVLVCEHKEGARAYPDFHMKRPHIAGKEDGDAVMTYCVMSHLGIAYEPAIEGRPLKLDVVGQHANNLLMRDKTTGEPIQQIYGVRDCDGTGGPGMKQRPTYRMSFRGFEKAYSQGTVFLNKIPTFADSPFLSILDNIVEGVVLWGTAAHHHSEDLLFETMSHEDGRLPRKALVWGISVGDDAAAFTQDFIVEQGNVLNVRVGDRDLVLAFDAQFESIGAFENKSGQPILQIDFWGNSNQGCLTRTEMLYPGLYWFVWANFFPNTKLNEDALVLYEEHGEQTDRRTAVVG